MKLTITIDCNNAAFEGCHLRSELERILMTVVPKVVRQKKNNKLFSSENKLMDLNGNVVGEVVVEPD